MIDAAAAARAWAEGWSRAWPAADADAVAALYAEDAVFYSHPFRNQQPPGDYAAWAFADQAAAECRFGEPIAAGDRAAVDWWAVITLRDGSVETIAGTSLLRFRADGRVIEQRDAWASEPGRRELSAWAPTAK
jgi:ketosteroid isomerase-like protein